MAKREIKHITITPAENGGHIVEHEYHRPAVDKHPLSYEEPEKHVFGGDEGHEMLAHVANHLNIPAHQDDDGDEDGD